MATRDPPFPHVIDRRLMEADRPEQVRDRDFGTRLDAELRAPFPAGRIFDHALLATSLLLPAGRIFDHEVRARSLLLALQERVGHVGARSVRPSAHSVEEVARRYV